MYKCSGREVVGSTAVYAWYDEINDYPKYYGENAADHARSVVRHFT